jgi:hypothetical protein
MGILRLRQGPRGSADAARARALRGAVDARRRGLGELDPQHGRGPGARHYNRAIMNGESLQAALMFFLTPMSPGVGGRRPLARGHAAGLRGGTMRLDLRDSQHQQPQPQPQPTPQPTPQLQLRPLKKPYPARSFRQSWSPRSSPRSAVGRGHVPLWTDLDTYYPACGAWARVTMALRTNTIFDHFQLFPVYNYHREYNVAFRSENRNWERSFLSVS